MLLLDPSMCPVDRWYDALNTPFMGNTFNPCFLAIGYILIAGTAAVSCGIQLLLPHRCFGNPLSVENVGFVQGLRVFLVGVQTFGAWHLARPHPFDSLLTLGYAALAASLLLLVAPLHILEPVRSPTASGTLLFFWLALAAFQVTVVLQETVVALLPQSQLVNAALGVNAVAVLLLEKWCWTPAKRLLGYYTAHALPLRPNVFSYITFSWLTPLISQSYRSGALEESLIPALPPSIDVVRNSSRVAAAWAARPALLLGVLVRVYGTDILTIGGFQLVECCVLFVQPFLLRLLIQFFTAYQTAQAPLLYGVVLCVAMFANSMLELLTFNFYFIRVLELGFNCKTSLMVMLYTKALRVSSEARQTSEDTDVINLVSVDVANLQNMSQNVQLFVSFPLKTALCVVSLYYLMGWAVLGGVSVLVLLIPLNVWLSRRMEKLYGEQMKNKDLRTKAINELLSSIKSIKLYAWEKPVQENIRHIRNNLELENIKKIGMFDSITVLFWEGLPFLITFVTFATFLIIGTEPLTPDIIFPALALFTIMGDLIYEIPGLISALIETRVSLKRLTKFMRADEVNQTLVATSGVQGEVAVVDSTFFWSNPSYTDEEIAVESKVALQNVSFSVRKGQLLCIVGTVGSGKTAMLKALLGELSAKTASVSVTGLVVYCAQSAWIMNGSVRDNITFGCKFDPGFYATTIEACALGPDMKVFPDGDQTQVGEKGISLSGGQKARIAIARAVYARADIYLLDDVLLAVDAHVAHHLTAHVLGPKGLLALKTKLLTTNAIPILRHADEILLMVGGRIAERNTYALASESSGIYALIKEHGIEQSGETSRALPSVTSAEEPVPSSPASVELYTGENPTPTGSGPFDVLSASAVEGEFVIEESEPHSLLNRRGSVVTLGRASVASFLVAPRPKDEEDLKTAQEAETSAVGYVKWDVYKEYAKACGVSACLLLSLFVVSSPLFGLLSKLWLKHWSEANEENQSNLDAWFNIGVYFMLGLSSALGSYFLALVMWCLCCLRASKVLHESILSAVLQSPMAFFETTPIGRILNRFTSDINQIDNGLPRVFDMVISCMVEITFSFIVITAILPPFGLFILVMLVFYAYYQNYYQVTSRELKRLLSVSLSPIFAHISETITGIDTVRAYAQQDRFEFLHVSNIIQNLKPAYANISSNRWISYRLRVLGAISLFVVSGLCIYSLITVTPMSAGMIGFLITSSLDVTTRLSWFVRLAVDAQTRIVCVERVMEYAKLTPEAVVGAPAPSNWPAAGAIAFNSYTTRYRANLDPVLHNVSLTIQPGEKIGIVGRTGAGKSTLTLALFRMIEATEGHITIDGVNTSGLGLFDLRSNLNIIPQDSQIFQGTIRRNLDPYSQHTDEELWKVLRLAHLETHVLSMGDVLETATSPVDGSDVPAVGLLSKVSEGGTNMSVGQRQLMCLARALLNPSQVLVLDEATSSVDVQTDKIIQETIRSEFAAKTILTIAHRLDTVMDCGRIVVLDKGEVKEFDSPATLLADRKGLFYGLCDQGGYLNKGPLAASDESS